jgi:hypothetical protein
MDVVLASLECQEWLVLLKQFFQVIGNTNLANLKCQKELIENRFKWNMIKCVSWFLIKKIFFMNSLHVKTYSNSFYRPNTSETLLERMIETTPGITVEYKYYQLRYSQKR